MAFERIEQQEHIAIELEILRFSSLGTITTGRLVGGVDELCGRWLISFGDRARPLVDVDSWMEAQHGRIWVGVRWQSVEVELIGRLRKPLVERFELLAVEGTRRTRLGKFDDDPVLLDIGDAKPNVRERRPERGSLRERLAFLQERVPPRAEGHIRR